MTETINQHERTVTVLTHDLPDAIQRYENKGWQPVGLHTHDDNTTTIILRKTES